MFGLAPLPAAEVPSHRSHPLEMFWCQDPFTLLKNHCGHSRFYVGELIFIMLEIKTEIKKTYSFILK